ncbi:lysoplasmalogenase family protein [Hoeflea sp.]|uniref:lysoplasmalogenase family protein n=1 Tax=Hoeflea sp. TaxID=1940281 RepID=UPI003B01180E
MPIFEYGIDSPQLGSLLLSAAAAFLYFLMVERQPSARRTGAKTLAIALLAALSVIVGGPVLLTAALLLCAAGDAFLAQDDERAFLIGLAAFLVGHILYVVLFLGLGSSDVVVAQPLRLGIGAAIVLAAMAASVRIIPAAGHMGPAVAAYIAVIVAMGLSALLMPGWGVVAGAVLFMASDTVLATQKFLLPPEEAPFLRARFVWVSYYLAQVLITLSILQLI